MASDDPAAFLNQPPSPEGLLLISQVDKHAGSHVAWWEFAEVAVRGHQSSQWIGQLEGFFKKVRRHARAAGLALLANLALAGTWGAHVIRESGAAEERAVQQEQRALERSELQEKRSLERRDVIEREIEGLQHQLNELRADLRRISGLPVEPPSSGKMWLSPDKLSLKGPSCSNFASRLP